MIDQLTRSLELIIEQTKHHAYFLLVMTVLLWAIYLLTCIDKRLLSLGIMPRRLIGLRGVLFAPFLHANANHLFFNLLPLLVLSNFLLIHGVYYFLLITFSITLISGLLIWCFAKPGVHVGASALITGYWALLVSNIYQQRSMTAIILGLVSAYYFAGIFLGLFPSRKGISWEGHLFGLLAGIIISFMG